MSDTTSQPDGQHGPASAEQVVVPVVPKDDKQQVERAPLDPTRYGDWEKNGRCIDF